MADNGARTLLEQLIRERLRRHPQTWAELVEDFHATARQAGEDASITERHLRRLASGERTTSHPATQRVLQRMFDRPARDLFGPPGGAPDDVEQSSPVVSGTPPTGVVPVVAPTSGLDASAAGVTPQLVASLHTIFTGYVQTDRLIGPAHLVEVAQQQAAWVERLTAAAPISARPEMLTVAAGFTEFAGWVLHDCGHYERAMEWTNCALGYAVEHGDPRLINYILTRKSNIATDAGHGGEGLSLAESALRQHDLTPRLRALSLRQQAQSYALIGDASECARSLDHAAAALENRTGDDNDRQMYCNPEYATPSYLEMEAANCWLRLDRPDKAVPILERGLHEWPTGDDERDRGMLLSRLATAHANNGDLDAACTYGGQAIQVVSAAHSTRAIRQLGQLHNRVADQELPGARDFTDAFTQLRLASQ